MINQLTKYGTIRAKCKIDYDKIRDVNGQFIMSMNVYSLLRRINTVKLVAEGCDFLLACETWTKPHITDNEISIAGKRHFRQDRLNVTAQRSGGLVFYVDQRFAPYAVLDANFSVCNDHFESICVKIEYPGHKKKAFISVYRSHKGSPSHTFKKLTELIQQHIPNNMEIWILGDLNIDSLKTNSFKFRSMSTFLKKNNLIHPQTDTTHFPPGYPATTIDHILTNCNCVAESGTLSMKVGDHVPVYVIRKKESLKQKLKQVTARKYNGYSANDTQAWARCLGPLSATSTAQADYSATIARIDSMLDKKHPIVTFKINPCQVIKKPRSIIILHRKKKRLLKKLRRKKYRDRQSLQQQMKLLDKEIRGLYRIIERKEVESGLKKANTPKKVSELIHRVWFGEKKIPTPMVLRDSSGQEISGEAVADFVNEYYTSIGIQLANDIPWSDVTPYIDKIESAPPLKIWSPSNSQEIKRIIADIDMSKSTNIPDIKGMVIEDIMKGNLDAVSNLINKSLATSSIPDEWKTGTVVPLEKSGDLTNVSNWRPVCLQNIYSKVTEKVVHNRLMKWILEHNIIIKQQFGFMPKKGTTDAIFHTVNHLFEARNHDKFSCAVFVDLRKAFDTLDHEILLRKLKKIGIEDDCLNWISEYLNNRQQCTRVNDSTSSPKKAPTGVPQGSVLGPLLFILYINDLVKNFTSCTYFLYADDLVMVLSDHDPVRIKTLIQEDLHALWSWCQANKLTVNTAKTKVLWCHKQTQSLENLDIDLFLGNSKLEIVQVFNYLGVSIDKWLKFDKQLQKQLALVRMHLRHLHRIKHKAPVPLRIQIYKQMVLPLAEYGDIISDSGPKTLLEQLQVTQNDCLRCCLGLRRRDGVSIDEIHRLANLDTLDRRRRWHLATFMFKAAQDPENRVVSSRTLRSNVEIKLKTLSGRLQPKYLDSPWERGVNIWRRLPPRVQHTKDIDSFKRIIKHFI